MSIPSQVDILLAYVHKMLPCSGGGMDNCRVFAVTKNPSYSTVMEWAGWTYLPTTLRARVEIVVFDRTEIG
jgi:hypothetical protein